MPLNRTIKALSVTLLTASLLILPSLDVFPDDKQPSTSETINTLLDLAARCDKCGLYTEATRDCDMILKLDPENIAATREKELINQQRPKLFGSDIITPHERSLSNDTWTITTYRIESTR